MSYGNGSELYEEYYSIYTASSDETASNLPDPNSNDTHHLFPKPDQNQFLQTVTSCELEDIDIMLDACDEMDIGANDYDIQLTLIDVDGSSSTPAIQINREGGSSSGIRCTATADITRPRKS